MCLCRVLRPRPDRSLLPNGAPMLPPCCQQRRLQRVVLSGLNRPALALAVYASPRGLPARDARLASGCWLSFAGWAWLPTKSLPQVSKCTHYIFSSSPKLCLAQSPPTISKIPTYRALRHSQAASWIFGERDDLHWVIPGRPRECRKLGYDTNSTN
jgi:hypothetical protein